MTDKIAIYECFFSQYAKVEHCKYYPKGCKSCCELIKVGERTEVNNDR